MFGFRKFLFLVVCFGICDAAFVDTLKKCKIDDQACVTKTLQEVVVALGKTGIPEYDIPKIDPMEVKSVNVNVLNLIDIKLNDAVIKGLKHCVVSDVNLQFERGFCTMKVLCDVTVKSKYEISGGSSKLKELFGGSSIKGNGNMKIKIEKISVKFDFYFDAVKHADGEIYLESEKKSSKYNYDLLGGTKIAIDKIYIGDVESSEVVVNYLNENSKVMFKEFGSLFMDQAMDVAYDYINKFLGSVPTKYYILDDLTNYLKN